MLFGILGWYGGYRKNSFMLAIYNLGNAIFLLTFVSISIGAFVFRKSFGELTVEDCKSRDWSTPIQNYASTVNDNFCHLECLCYVDKNKFPANYFDGVIYFSTDM